MRLSVLRGLAWRWTRGRGGGLRLLKPADQIVLGTVVRQTETDFNLVECFDPAVNTCRLDGLCQLKRILKAAMAEYLAVLDGVTLADLVTPGHLPSCEQVIAWVPRA